MTSVSVSLPLLVTPPPLRVDLPDVHSISETPAGWHVVYPDQYNAEYARDLVHTPTVLYHNLFLLGLLMVVGASVGRSHRRTVRRGGIALAVAGVIAQLAVSPFGWTG